MPRAGLAARLLQAQQRHQQQGLQRRLQRVDAVQGPWLQVDGRKLLGFSSNDYLGLAQEPRVRHALQQAANQWGVGSGAAPVPGGYRQPHAELQEAIAEWTGRDRALLFGSGYQANVGVLAALLQHTDLCVQDRLNHASLIDGARLSGALLRRYRHADIDSARRQLQQLPGAAAMLATDGVFSMDGDPAPLAALAALCTAENALLLVDDAHGMGVCGPHGAGSVAQAGLDQKQVPLLVGTLGKALGCSGAFVAGPAKLVDALLQFSRTQMYSTAMPPALAAAASTAINIARSDDGRRAHLQHLIGAFRAGAVQRNLPLLQSDTPIQPLLVGSGETAVQCAAQLAAAGFHVPAIRTPTVPAGQARLRITLSALHDMSQIEQLLDALATIIPHGGDVQ